MDGYTRLEYIESSGTQYIDTGFKPNQDTKVIADMLLVSNNASLAANEFFGARTSTSSKAYALQYNDSSSYLQLFYGGGYTNQSESLPTERTVYELNKGTISYNGKSIVRDYTTFQCAYPMYIFALNNAGSVAFQSIARLYSFQIYDNGTLVRDLVPAKNSDGVCGLYDQVNDVFYASATSTNFTGVELKPKANPFGWRRRLMTIMGAAEQQPDYSTWRGVYIEDVDGKLWTSDEWDGSVTPNGVAVLTDDCRFVVALEDASSGQTMRWGGYGYLATEEVSGGTSLQTDFDGKRKTDLIIAALNGYYDGYITGSPAATYSKSTKFPNGNDGYLGAFGEWNALEANLTDVNNCLSVCGGYTMSRYYWTSSEYNESYVWGRDLQGTNSTSYKYDTKSVRPFTTLKSETV